MAKYTIDIPDELLPYMTENLPSAPAYIRAVLLTPLLVRFKQDERERIFAVQLDELKEKLSAMEKGAKIKKEKNTFNESHLEEAKDIPVAPEAPKPEPVEETVVPQAEAIVETFEAPVSETKIEAPAEEPAPEIPA